MLAKSEQKLDEKEINSDRLTRGQILCEMLNELMSEDTSYKRFFSLNPGLITQPDAKVLGLPETQNKFFQEMTKTITSGGTDSFNLDSSSQKPESIEDFQFELKNCRLKLLEAKAFLENSTYESNKLKKRFKDLKKENQSLKEKL